MSAAFTSASSSAASSSASPTPTSFARFLRAERFRLSSSLRSASPRCWARSADILSYSRTSAATAGVRSPR
jgi:hypothetical protein